MTQIDLPSRQKSGLEQAVSIVENLRGIARVDFTAADVVRNDLVARIIDAYAKQGDVK